VLPPGWQSVIASGLQTDNNFTEVIFWHGYNRSGTLTFKVKMVGLSLSGHPINPTMQSVAGLFWFLTSSCFRLIE